MMSKDLVYLKVRWTLTGVLAIELIFYVNSALALFSSTPLSANYSCASECVTIGALVLPLVWMRMESLGLGQWEVSGQ